MKAIEYISKTLLIVISSLVISCSDRIDAIGMTGTEKAEIRFRLISGHGSSKAVYFGSQEPVSNDVNSPYLRNFCAVVSSADKTDYRIYGSFDECSNYYLDCSDGWDYDFYSMEVEGIPIGGPYVLRVLANCGEAERFSGWTDWNMKIPYAGSLERGGHNPVVPMYGATMFGAGFESDMDYGSYTDIYLRRLMACVSIGSVSVNIPEAPGAELKRIFISNAPDYTYIDTPLAAYNDQMSLSRIHSLHNSVMMRSSGGYSDGSDWGYIPGDGTYTSDYSETRDGCFQPLYVFPTDGTYSDLIFSVVYSGTEYFYRADIPSLDANTLYNLYNVTIKSLGNPDPEFPSNIDVSSSFFAIPWSELSTYDEIF